ncbi:MAG TPA: folylpolyglutamate synthase/dihydrofolate synthase family protein, partial [Planctomycetaceae bacterium]|nr:folylpolyglutamate synthase/dihydrofolate synthase family protein [Planctomycetaceae bacterium]
PPPTLDETMTSTIDSYEHALAWLAGRTNYERTPPGRGGAAFKLGRMRQLLARLGDPHERLPALHIAGTKGKGSTAAMTAAMLSAAGYRTGLFTSPHVHRFEERMTVDGLAPTASELTALARDVSAAARRLDAAGPELAPTYFELATAMAWLHFERQSCDLAVLEVGLGGRLDATNLCRPAATAVTNISFDHTDVLGHTLEAIASEKAGIIKPGVSVVSGVEAGPPRDVIVEHCRRQGCRLFELGCDVRYDVQGCERMGDETGTGAPDAGAVCGGQRIDLAGLDRHVAGIHLPLAGAHQAANAALALGLVDLAGRAGWPVPDAAVRGGLERVAIPVRIEFFPRRPLVVIDAAHNVASTAALVATLRAHAPAAVRRVLIFAVSRDKDAGGMLRLLQPAFGDEVLTRYGSNARGLPVERLREIADPQAGAQGRSSATGGGGWRVHVAPDPRAAWALAHSLAGPDDLVCVTGSFYLAAELRSAVLAEQP